MNRSILDIARHARVVAFFAAASLGAIACAPVDSDRADDAPAAQSPSVHAQASSTGPAASPSASTPGRGAALAEPVGGPHGPGAALSRPAIAEPFSGGIEPASPAPGAPGAPQDIGVAFANHPTHAGAHALADREPVRADDPSSTTRPGNLDHHRVRIEPVLTTNDDLDDAPSGAAGSLDSGGEPTEPTGADPALVPAVVAAQNRFGNAVFGHLADEEPHANVALSPLSIATALSMTRAGAESTTADQMDDVLNLGAIGTSADDVHAGLAAYQLSLMDAEAMTMANRIWLQDGVEFEAPFLDRMARFYGAGAELVDFARSSAAKAAINEWVNDNTKDRIPELIPDGVIDQDTQMVLTNALTFDGTWTTPFDPDLTAPHDFVTAAGDSVDVDMMHNPELFVPTGVSDGVRVVELPYENDDSRWSLVVAMPVGDTPLAELEARVASDGIAGLRDGMERSTIDLRMPSFSLRQNVSLPEALSALGMPRAFVPTGDFRPMSHAFDDTPLYIDDVIHEAMVEVDEKGTKAAAATAVVMAKESAAMGPPPTPVTIDRAFVFAIVDAETGGTIFLGRMADPEA